MTKSLASMNKESNITIKAMIEDAREEKDSDQHQSGTLFLIEKDSIFYIVWKVDSKFHGLGPSNNLLKEDLITKPWDFFQPFCVDCSRLQMLSLIEEPDSFTLLKLIKAGDLPRKFVISEDSFPFFATFIEELIINGCIVPSTDSFNSSFTFMFNSNCKKGFGSSLPIFDHLIYSSTVGLPEFWKDVIDFYCKVMKRLSKANAFSSDNSYPLVSAAEYEQGHILKIVEEANQANSQYTKITSEEWPTLFDSTGKMKIDFDTFRKRVFYGGIDTDLNEESLQFITGLFPTDSTSEFRQQRMAELSQEFEHYRRTALQILSNEAPRHYKLNEYFKTIIKDINRTDRGDPLFEDFNGQGLTSLTTLLQSYLVYNQSVGYLQGMNDLFVPFLKTVAHWEGGSSSDLESRMPLIFWLFTAMMENIDHIPMMKNPPLMSMQTARKVMKILDQLSPLHSIWLRSGNHVMDLIWLYPDLITLYKRSFVDNIWRFWHQLNCSPKPQEFLVYFAAATMIVGFQQVSKVPEVSVQTIMSSWQPILESLNIETVSNVALWLMDNISLEDDAKITEHVDEAPKEEFKFEFFHASFMK